MVASRGLVAIAVVCASCGDDSPAHVDAHVSPVTVTLSTEPMPAAFVAFQDGDGEWQTLSPTSGASYEASVTSGRYGIAVVCVYPSFGSVTSTAVIHALTAETTSLRRGCNDAPATVKVSGNIVGLAISENHQVTFGGTTYGSNMASYSISIRPGTYRPLGARLTSGGDPVEVLRLPSRSITAATTIDFDFDAGGAPLDLHPLTVTGVAANEIVGAYSYLADDVGTYTQLAYSGATSWPALPSTLALTGDYYDLYVDVRSAGLTRWVSRSLAGGSAQIVTPPPTVTTSGPIVSPSPIRLQGAVTAVAAAHVYSLFAFQFDSTTAAMINSITTTTAGYVGPASSAELAQPDFTALAGWNPAWNFRAGAELQWTLGASWSNGTLVDSINPGMQIVGREYLGADATGAITP